LKGDEKMKKCKRGQSVLEYVIVLTAIIAAVILGSNLIKNSVNTSLSNAAQTIEGAASRLPK
jgi:uncharacterized protein (UPF0333 family)